MKTGVNATKRERVHRPGYIFCMNPAMLLIDVSALSIIQIVITSFLGIFGVAARRGVFAWQYFSRKKAAAAV